MPAKTIGLISDTHGLLRPEALAALQGSDFIIHAGDIGDPAILDALREIAPLTAVRGNNDWAPWASRLPHSATLETGKIRIHVLHDIAEFRLDPATEGFHAVVTGHSHKPEHREVGGVHFINPGSAGPRRFALPIAVGRLRIAGVQINAELIELAVTR